LLKKVVQQPDEELYRQLSHLQAAEFLYEQPAFPDVEYIFKHALTQEVAYNSLLQEQRKVLHERAARAIEQLCQGRLDEHYSDLAHHYSRSGNTEKAVEYLGLAGQQAEQRSAYTEAITHLTTALELLKTLPDTPERTQQELNLLITLGPALTATKGWAAPEVGRAYARAQELCRQVGKTAQSFPVLWGLWVFYLNRGELETAHELGEQLLSLAQNIQDPALLLEAHLALGYALYFLGEFIPAREHSEQGVALYNPQQHRSLAFLYGGTDPGMGCRVLAAQALWSLGYPAQALKRSNEALILARELSHPHSMAFALGVAARVCQFHQERQAAQERAEAAISLSTEHGFPFWLGWASVLRGWAVAEQGEGEEGITQIRQGLAVYRATGAEVNQSYFLALLTEAYGVAGQTEEGLTVLAEALTLVGGTGERMWEAELYRLKGELTLQREARDWRLETGPSSQAPSLKPPVPSGVAQEAEEYFLKAIDVARKQQAKSLELRASTSLARLWQQQGKGAEAHATLSEVYNWFTEGFDTKDLQEAKALLEELRN
jgi:predicted ATPase